MRMRTLDIALRLYEHYEQVEEINNYYGLLALYGLAQVSSEKGDFSCCRRFLRRFPDGIRHPHYNFACYRIGGNAAAWADYRGLQSCVQLKDFAQQTMQGSKGPDGLLCMPGSEARGAIWIDTAAAVTPFMLFAGLSCRCSEYIDFAAEQCFGLYEALLDRECGLLHQSRGFLAEPLQCSEDHWSRGNGWGYMALAELVQYLPHTSRHRRQAERCYTELTDRLLAYQNDRGLWRQEITRPDAWEESSGTALILYGMGIGIRLGLLRGERYTRAFSAGIAGLVRWCMNADFSTERSCPGCLCPGDGSIRAYITQKQPEHDEHHSFGAYMLALAEAHRNGITEMEIGAEK